MVGEDGFAFYSNNLNKFQNAHSGEYVNLTHFTKESTFSSISGLLPSFCMK